jgi:hypothetical protein
VSGGKAGDRRFRLHCRNSPFCRISLPFPSVVLSRRVLPSGLSNSPPSCYAPTRPIPPNRKLQFLLIPAYADFPTLCCPVANRILYDDELPLPSVRFRFRAPVPGDPSSVCLCPSLFFFCSSSFFNVLYLFFYFFSSEIFLFCPPSSSHYSHRRVFPLVRIDSFSVPLSIPHHGFRKQQDQGQEPSGGTGW